MHAWATGKQAGRNGIHLQVHHSCAVDVAGLDSQVEPGHHAHVTASTQVKQADRMP